MDNLRIFKNENFGEVRTVLINNSIWFVAKDICRILDIQNTTQALENLDKDERAMFNIGRQGSSNIINESGLYALVIRSKKPEAKKFRKWITNEVLPSIRKHGMYITDDLIDNPDLAIATFTALKEERKKLKKLNRTIENQNQQLAVKNQQISEMTAKASYYDVVLNCEDLVAISTISKDYGWSAKKLNNYLSEKKDPIQARRNMAFISKICRKWLYKHKDTYLFK